MSSWPGCHLSRDKQVYAWQLVVTGGIQRAWRLYKRKPFTLPPGPYITERALQGELVLARVGVNAGSVYRPRRGPIGGLAAAGSQNGHCTVALGQVH